MTDETVETIESLNEAIAIVNPEKWEASKIYDLNRLIRHHQSFFPYGTWFRGQPNAEWRLIPSIFRDESCAKSETTIIAATKSQLFKYNHNNLSTLDWLCVMQHHGCPTRLIDFTENILYALFFAVENDFDKDGALFVFNTFKLNYLTAGGATRLYHDDLPVWLRGQLAAGPEYISLLWYLKKERPGDVQEYQKRVTDDNLRQEFDKYLKTPVAFWPQYVHDRMFWQKSVFVLSGGSCSLNSDFGSPTRLEELNEDDATQYKFLKKFIIPSDKKEKIKHELRSIGIERASLFPELEYQAKAIANTVIPKIST